MAEVERFGPGGGEVGLEGGEVGLGGCEGFSSSPE